MRTKEDIQKDLTQISSSQGYEIAIRWYARVIAELLLDIRDHLDVGEGRITKAIENQRYQ